LPLDMVWCEQEQQLIVEYYGEYSPLCGDAQVSGKNWKASAPRMSSTGNPILKTSWEKKMAVKAEAALFKAQKDEARAEHNAKLAVSAGAGGASLCAALVLG